jgi:hypothetical protein
VHRLPKEVLQKREVTTRSSKLSPRTFQTAVMCVCVCVCVCVCIALRRVCTAVQNNGKLSQMFSFVLIVENVAIIMNSRGNNNKNACLKFKEVDLL